MRNVVRVWFIFIILYLLIGAIYSISSSIYYSNLHTGYFRDIRYFKDIPMFFPDYIAMTSLLWPVDLSVISLILFGELGMLSTFIFAILLLVFLFKLAKYLNKTYFTSKNIKKTSKK